MDDNEFEKADGRPPWPIWSDEEVNKFKWEDADADFLDPTGETMMPLSISSKMKKKWQTPSAFFKNPQGPPVLVNLEGNDKEKERIDLITPNAHLCRRSTIIRFILSEISELHDFSKNNPKFKIEGDGKTFKRNSTARWKPWNHIYSHNKAGEKGDYPKFNKSGRYFVRLYYMGSWRKITVDDRIPVLKNKSPGLPLSSRNELWPLILTKALLKIASLTWTDDVEIKNFSTISCLTGWIHQWNGLQTPLTDEELWNQLIEIIPKYIPPNAPLPELSNTDQDQDKEDQDKNDQFDENESELKDAYFDNLAQKSDQDQDDDGDDDNFSDSDEDENEKENEKEGESKVKRKNVKSSSRNDDETINEFDQDEIKSIENENVDEGDYEVSKDLDVDVDSESDKIDTNEGKSKSRPKKSKSSETGSNKRDVDSESEKMDTNDGKDKSRSKLSSRSKFSKSGSKNSLTLEKDKSTKSKSSESGSKNSLTLEKDKSTKSKSSESGSKNSLTLEKDRSGRSKPSKSGSKNSLTLEKDKSGRSKFSKTGSKNSSTLEKDKSEKDNYDPELQFDDNDMEKRKSSPSILLKPRKFSSKSLELSTGDPEDGKPKSPDSDKDKDSNSLDYPDERKRSPQSQPNSLDLDQDGKSPGKFSFSKSMTMSESPQSSLESPLSYFGSSSGGHGHGRHKKDSKAEDADQENEDVQENSWDLSNLPDEINWDEDLDPNNPESGGDDVNGDFGSSKKKKSKNLPRLSEIIEAVQPKVNEEVWDKLLGQNRAPFLTCIIVQAFPTKDLDGREMGTIPQQLFHPVHLVQIRDTDLLYPETLPPLPLWKTYRWKDWAQKRGLYPLDPPERSDTVIRSALLRSPVPFKNWKILEENSKYPEADDDDDEEDQEVDSKKGKSGTYSTALKFGAEEAQAPLLELPRPSIVLDADALAAFAKMRGKESDEDSDENGESSNSNTAYTGLSEPDDDDEKSEEKEQVEEDSTSFCASFWIDFDTCDLPSNIQKMCKFYPLRSDYGSCFILKKVSPPEKAFEEFDDLLNSIEMNLSMKEDGESSDTEAVNDLKMKIREQYEVRDIDSSNDLGVVDKKLKAVKRKSAEKKDRNRVRSSNNSVESDDTGQESRSNESGNNSDSSTSSRGRKSKSSSKKKRKNRKKSSRQGKSAQSNELQLAGEKAPVDSKEIENYHSKPNSKNHTIKFDISSKPINVYEYHCRGLRGIDSAFYIFSDCWLDQELLISVEILQASAILKFTDMPMDAENGIVKHIKDLPQMNLTLIIESWDWKNDNCVKVPILSKSVQSNWITRVPLPSGRNTLRLWLAQDLLFPENSNYTAYNSIFKNRVEELSSFDIKIRSKTPIHVGTRLEIQNYMTNPPMLLLKQAEKLTQCLWTLFSTFGKDSAKKPVAHASEALAQLRSTYFPNHPNGQRNFINWKLKDINGLFNNAFVSLIWKLNNNKMSKWMILALRVLFLDPNAGNELIKLNPKLNPNEIVEGQKTPQSQEAEIKDNDEEDQEEISKGPRDMEKSDSKNEINIRALSSDEKTTNATQTIQKFYRGWRVRRLFQIRKKGHKLYRRVEYNLRKIALLLAQNCDSKFSNKKDKRGQSGSGDDDGLVFLFSSLGHSENKPKLVPNPPKWAVDLLVELFDKNPWLITTHPHAYCAPKHIVIKEFNGILPFIGNQRELPDCVPFFQKAFEICEPTKDLMCQIDLTIPHLQIGWKPLIKIFSNDTYKPIPKLNRAQYLGKLPKNQKGYTVRAYLERFVDQDENKSLDQAGDTIRNRNKSKSNDNDTENNGLNDGDKPVETNNSQKEWKLRIIIPHFQRNALKIIADE